MIHFRSAALKEGDLEVAGSVSCQFLSKRKESPVRGDGMFVLILIAPHGVLY